jgi:hypothetical protein
MKPMHAAPIPLVMRPTALALIAMFALASSTEAAEQTKNPAGKFFVADVEGQAQVDMGGKIEELTKKSVYAAQGSVVETKARATNAMVFSNGTGLYFEPNTRLEIKRFVQEPFAPNRTDLDVEPSISQSQMYLARGSVGLCTSKLSPGSAMTYLTAYASIAIRGGRVVIEADDNATKVSLLDGDITVRGGELDRSGRTLKKGQQALVTPAREGLPNIVTILEIPANELPGLDRMITTAFMAKNTVYFDVASQSASGQTIVAVPVVPRNLPVQFTVSPARLRNP